MIEGRGILFYLLHFVTIFSNLYPDRGVKWPFVDFLNDFVEKLLIAEIECLTLFCQHFYVSDRGKYDSDFGLQNILIPFGFSVKVNFLDMCH